MLCGSIHLVYGEYKLLEVEAAEVVPLKNCTGLLMDVMSLLKCLLGRQKKGAQRGKMLDPLRQCRVLISTGIGIMTLRTGRRTPNIL
jgi:hypothetical protein